MLDLNDLWIFEKVGRLGNLAAASRASMLPESSVLRSVARLERALKTRLIVRRSEDVVLTASGEVLMLRCSAALEELTDVADSVARVARPVEGELLIGADVGFGINVLAGRLPGFMARHPDVAVRFQLSNRMDELLASAIDVAVRLGPSTPSDLAAIHLGTVRTILCASPAYLATHAVPANPIDCARLDVIDLRSPQDRRHPWSFTRAGETSTVAVVPKVTVNEPTMIHRLVLNGAGVGIIACYLCAPSLKAGELVHLLPQWSTDGVDVDILFPSQRESAPAVRAFVDYMTSAILPDMHLEHTALPHERRD